MSRASLASRITAHSANSSGWDNPERDRGDECANHTQCQWAVDDTNHALMGKETKPDLVAGTGTTEGKPVTVSYLTEQTSHHPPVSAFWVDCPEKGISACGYDQLSAKFTGTSIKVTPGIHNKGIFINLHRWGDEEYQLIHPAAYLCGLLKGMRRLSFLVDQVLTASRLVVRQCRRHVFRVLQEDRAQDSPELCRGGLAGQGAKQGSGRGVQVRRRE